MYTIPEFGVMISDRLRTDGYAKALAQVITPDSIMVDIGTGTGIWALLACKYGARRVYAIERDEAIVVAKEVAAANGYADRIEFIQDLSFRVSLPELANVAVFEIHRQLPLYGQSLASIIDARKRLLAPGGVLIPQRETIWAAVVEADDLYDRYIGVWDARPYGFDMSAARRFSANSLGKGRVRPEHLLVEPQVWVTLDYKILESPDVSADLRWTAGRRGIGHGLILWFDAMLGDGVQLSNAPGAPELIFGHAFLPWLEPVALEAGDTVCVSLQAVLIDDEYVWRWNTRVLSADSSARVKACFSQSTFYSTPVSADHLRKATPSHVPSPGEEAEVDRFVLELMDGGRSVAEIASSAWQRFPGRYADRRNALTHVGLLSRKYSR